MVEKKDQIEQLLRVNMSPEAMQEFIATELSAGNTSPLFQKVLAKMLQEGNPFPFKLEVKRRSPSRPKGIRINAELAPFMVDRCDVKGASTDEAVYQAIQKFGKAGTSRATCMNALKYGRQMQSLIDWKKKGFRGWPD